MAIIATEPKTVFPVIPSHDNLMCSLRAKLSSPQKGRQQTLAALERHCTLVDTQTPFFGGIYRRFRRFHWSLDVLKRYWMVPPYSHHIGTARY
jgi:hypothetical protein